MTKRAEKWPIIGWWWHHPHGRGGLDIGTDKKNKTILQIVHSAWPGAHHPERATYLFRATTFSQVSLFLDTPFPPKITVSGYLRIAIWVNKKWRPKAVVFSSVFRFPLVVFHHSNLSFPSTGLPTIPRVLFWALRPLVHFSECEFVRLNPRFGSFSRAFVMIKYTFKRIRKKWKYLIVMKKYLRW